MAPTRGQKILRRTLTGGTLVLVVAGLLFWTSRSPRGEPILYVSVALLLGAIVEATRMGSLGTRDLFPSLVIPAVAAIFALMQALEPRGGWKLQGAYLFCAVLAACSYALGQTLSGILSKALARAVVYGLGAWAILSGQDDVIGAGLTVFVAFGAIAMIWLAFRSHRWRGLAIATGLAVWIIPPIWGIWGIWDSWATRGLIAFLLCAKIGDTAGYYVGTAIGKRHPFPTISPGKTVAGCVGSFIAGTVAGGVAVATDLLPGSIPAGLAAGALVNLAAQTGDLLESWIKRKAGVKDSSTVFGPSGGLLDQIDSLLVAVPVAVLAWPWLLGSHPASH